MEKAKKSFYITTPIYYINDKPHLGTAYSTIMVDILSRYRKLFGEEVLFLTGTDEHGQKCEQTAKKQSQNIKTYCDNMVENFKKTWKELQIGYDIFFRTTHPDHKKGVQKALQIIYEKGEIYKGTYEGVYCVSEEIFYTQKDLINGKTPSGKEVITVSEEGYFFRMSKYQEALIQHIETHPDFISPVERRNEVLGFLKKPLGDLNISRPKSRLKWGVELPFDQNYVCYVWFDALLNYVTALGFGQEGSDHKKHFKKWWEQAETCHLIGKDILITHSVYWPTMLMAIGIPLPKKILSTGWILNKDLEKMSKSQGEVIHPLDLKDIVGVEVMRYFFARSVPMGKDSPFSYHLLRELGNSELSNHFGNLVSRVVHLIGEHFDGRCPKLPLKKKVESGNDESLKLLILKTEALAGTVKESVFKLRIHWGLEKVVELLRLTNRFLEEKEPWKKVLTQKKEAGECLASALEVLRVVSVLLSPILPKSCDVLLKRFHCEGQKLADVSVWGYLQEGQRIERGEALFPRLKEFQNWS